MFIADSTMFLYSAASRPALSSLVRTSNFSELPDTNGTRAESHARHLEEEFDIRPGKMDEYHSLTNILDCCILYYYAVGHKYIVMVSFDRSGQCDFF